MRPPLAVIAAVVAVAGCSCAAAATPPPTTKPPARLIIWADSHGDEPTDWPAKIGCADKIDAKIGWAIADQGSIAPPPLIDQIDTLAKGLRKGDRVVIALGANDGADWQPPFADQVRDEIRDKITKRGAVDIWTTIPPTAASYGRFDALVGPRRLAHNKWVRSLPTNHQLDLAVSLGDTLEPAEQIGDGVHLSATSQAAMARVAKGLCR